MTVEPDTELKPSRAAFADGPRLLADIGATHARFGLETAPGVLRQVSVLHCDDYSGIVPLLHAYLAQTGGVRINFIAREGGTGEEQNQQRNDQPQCHVSILEAAGRAYGNVSEVAQRAVNASCLP